MTIWVWVNLNHQESDCRFWSMFPFTRIPFWVHIFDPQPFDIFRYMGKGTYGHFAARNTDHAVYVSEPSDASAGQDGE